MPKCKKCGAEFSNRVAIDGKQKSVQNRKFCLDCSPYGRHNTVDLTIVKNRLVKVCPRCEMHLPAEAFYKRRDGKDLSPYCKQCTSDQTVERMRRFKQECVTYKGGKCFRCGYNRCIDALEFHHTNPKEKDIQLSAGKGYRFEKAIPELEKCILVCANCHREIHAAMRLLLRS